MRGPSDPFAYHRPTPRSTASAARLPIISGQSAPDTDDRMPLLFDDVGLVSPRQSRHRTADVSRGTGRPTAGDTSHTAPDSHEHDLLRQRPSVTSDPAPLTSLSVAPMLLTVRQVEAALQLGRTRTYELLRSGQLPTLRVGRLIRVSRVALEEWIARQVAAGCD
jgi:excisionase family DNA binding protein